MNAKSQFNETVIANSLVAIFERLTEIEKSINILAAATSSIAKPHAELLTMLDRLTLKRHAVLTATLMGASYQDVADKLGCDTTTIKLQLKAALEVVGVKNRTESAAPCCTARPDLRRGLPRPLPHQQTVVDREQPPAAVGARTRRRRTTSIEALVACNAIAQTSTATSAASPIC